MKKHVIGLSLSLGMMFSSFGQSNYTFTKAAGIYSPLDNPTIISSTEGWNDDMFTLSLGTSINFMGTQTDSLLILEGQITNYGTFNSSNQFSLPETPILTVAGIDLIDRAGEGTPTSESPIGFKLSGSSGNHILKVEYKQVSFESASDPTTNTASFQIWYYEADQKVEYHYGNSSFSEWTDIASANSPEGLQVSLTSSFDYNGQTGSFLFLDGDEATPAAQTATLSPSNIPNLSLNQFPVEGSIYRFETSGSTIGIPEFNPELSVYPNPVSTRLFLNISESETIQIYTATGQMVLHTLYSESGIPVVELPQGIYILKTQDKQIRFVKL